MTVNSSKPRKSMFLEARTYDGCAREKRDIGKKQLW